MSVVGCCGCAETDDFTPEGAQARLGALQVPYKWGTQDMASASAKAGARAGGGGPDPLPPSPFEARVPAAGAAHPELSP